MVKEWIRLEQVWGPMSGALVCNESKKSCG